MGKQVKFSSELKQKLCRRSESKINKINSYLFKPEVKWANHEQVEAYWEISERLYSQLSH